MQCGSPTLTHQAKVVGGKNAAFGAWPWQVSHATLALTCLQANSLFIYWYTLENAKNTERLMFFLLILLQGLFYSCSSFSLLLLFFHFNPSFISFRSLSGEHHFLAFQVHIDVVEQFSTNIGLQLLDIALMSKPSFIFWTNCMMREKACQLFCVCVWRCEFKFNLGRMYINIHFMIRRKRLF